MQDDWWHYDKLESRVPCDWSPATRGDVPWDQIDFHLDIGCGTVPKARMGIDRYPAPGVDLAIDLETLSPAPLHSDKNEAATTYQQTVRRYTELGLGMEGVLPFPDDSINGVISHHCLEHLADGFIPLMDEIHRVMVPGSFFRIIVPAFPSKTAVEDPDHKRYFMESTFDNFCGAQDGSHWMEGFSVPYTSCRFEMASKDQTAIKSPDERWTFDDAREMRVTLRKWTNLGGA